MYFLRARVVTEHLCAIYTLSGIDLPSGLADNLVYDRGSTSPISIMKRPQMFNHNPGESRTK